MSDKPGSELMVSNNGALMRLETYQQQALTTAVFPPDRGLEYLGCGLASEAGEVAGKIAKAFRGDRELDAGAVISELGDVLWFVAVLSSYLGYTLDDVAAENLRKLAARSKAGTLKGDGDTR